MSTGDVRERCSVWKIVDVQGRNRKRKEMTIKRSRGIFKILREIVNRVQKEDPLRFGSTVSGPIHERVWGMYSAHPDTQMVNKRMRSDFGLLLPL